MDFKLAFLVTFVNKVRKIREVKFYWSYYQENSQISRNNCHSHQSSWLAYQWYQIDTIRRSSGKLTFEI